MQRPITFARIAAGALTAIVLTASASSHADDASPYCRKVRARAHGDAALLFAPSVQAQGIKFPNNGNVDTGVTAGTGYQFRAAFSFSPLDVYRGFGVLNVADADCMQHDASVSAQRALLQGPDFGKLPALRKQAAFLDARASVWEGILAKNDERVAAQVISIVDANDLRMRGADLSRKRAQVAGDTARLEALGFNDERVDLQSLVDRADAEAMTFEREASHLRKIDPWQVTMSGGVIPQYAPLDYFGVVQVGYNFGGLWRGSSESTYLDARSEELKNARYELRDQMRRFRDQIHAAANEARSEIAIVDGELTALAALRETLSHADASAAPHALSVLDMQTILLESDRVFLSAFLGELTRTEK